jgi:Holliday junction DNA helicase RuvA
MNPSQIMVAIMSDDTALLCQAPGVGKKTAKRISLELRDKIKSKATAVELSAGQQSIAAMDGSGKDALDALEALGYGHPEALRAVMEVAVEGMEAGQIIRLALKKLL